MPDHAFDRLAVERLAVDGGVIRVGFAPGSEFALPRARILDYVGVAARSVAAYFGRFPASDTRLLILATDSPGRAVRLGTAFGYDGAAILLMLACDVGLANLERDWISSTRCAISCSRPCRAVSPGSRKEWRPTSNRWHVHRPACSTPWPSGAACSRARRWACRRRATAGWT
jgi:hypothetical protein